MGFRTSLMILLLVNENLRNLNCHSKIFEVSGIKSKNMIYQYMKPSFKHVSNINSYTCVCSSGSVDGIYGPVKNPWKYNFSNTLCEDQQSRPLEQIGIRSYHTSTDDWHVAGGSSGGSAVAVASGVCFG